MADQNILLVVNGGVVRDDLQVLAGITGRIAAMQARVRLIQDNIGVLMSELTNEVAGLLMDVQTLQAEVEELLTMPDPDTTEAVAKIREGRTTLQAVIGKLNEAQGQGGGEPLPV